MAEPATWLTFHRHWRELADELVQPPFVLIDAAGLAAGWRGLPRDACAELESLFDGDLADELSEVGPYLGQAAGWSEPVARRLWPLLYDRSALLLWPLDPESTFATLRRHLRKFNIVYDRQGCPQYFRYCDPRVLLTLLYEAKPVVDCGPLLQPAAGLLTVDGADELQRVLLQGGRVPRIG